LEGAVGDMVMSCQPVLFCVDEMNDADSRLEGSEEAMQRAENEPLEKEYKRSSLG
jgi:hypothetical protein